MCSVVFFFCTMFAFFNTCSKVGLVRGIVIVIAIEVSTISNSHLLIVLELTFIA